MVEITSINLGQKIALTSDDGVVPIHTLLDSEANAGCSQDSAVCAIAGPDKFGEWHSFLLSDFEDVRLN